MRTKKYSVLRIVKARYGSLSENGSTQGSLASPISIASVIPDAFYLFWITGFPHSYLTIQKI